MSHPSLQHKVVRLDNATHDSGKRVKPVTLIVLHDTMGHSALSSIEYMNTTRDKASSYNYIIDRDGSMFRHTPNVACHAGDSQWPNPIRATPKNQKPHGGRSVNSISWGIAFASLDEPPTPEQLESALWLCATCMALNPGVTVDRVRAHYEVSPGRKFDPTPPQMDAFRLQLRDYLAAA